MEPQRFGFEEIRKSIGTGSWCRGVHLPARKPNVRIVCSLPKSRMSLKRSNVA